MRRHILTSTFLALICGQMARGQQAPPPKPRGQNTAAIKVYPARGKRIRIVAGFVITTKENKSQQER